MFIPDTGSKIFHPGSRVERHQILDLAPQQRMQALLTPIFLLSSWKYDPGYSLRILDPRSGLYSYLDPGSWIRNTGNMDPIVWIHSKSLIWNTAVNGESEAGGVKSLIPRHLNSFC
jgi:hypothetical protein